MKKLLLISLIFVLFVVCACNRPPGGAKPTEVSITRNDSAYCYSLKSHKIDNIMGFAVTVFPVPVSKFTYANQACELWIPARLYYRLVALEKTSPNTPILIYYIDNMTLALGGIMKQTGDFAYDYSFNQSFAELK